MLHSRAGHGVVLVGKQIYVIGGIYNEVWLRKCEAFDLIKSKWTKIPDFDEFCVGVTLLAIK